MSSHILFMHFNPRSRTGSDSHLHTSSPLSPLFQSTLPHGERLGWIIDIIVLAIFQSTLPHGERRCCSPAGAGCLGFQSTLPHGERPRGAQGVLPLFPISIHAPARGATGAEVTVWNLTLYFNPRSRTGSDGAVKGQACLDILFQSTLPHGERHDACVSKLGSFLFQSTLPHGERPTGLLTWRCT